MQQRLEGDGLQFLLQVRQCICLAEEDALCHGLGRRVSWLTARGREGAPEWRDLERTSP